MLYIYIYLYSTKRLDSLQQINIEQYKLNKLNNYVHQANHSEDKTYKSSLITCLKNKFTSLCAQLDKQNVHHLDAYIDRINFLGNINCILAA